MSLVASGFSSKLRFKLHVLSRNGEYLRFYDVPSGYKPRASFELDLSKLLADMKLPDDDYLVVAVLSRGRMDARRSPGSFSMTYVDQDNVAIYRTGAFARPLNEGRLKSHVGFTGIDPKVIATSEVVSGLMLINHSSDPEYAFAARPELGPDPRRRRTTGGRFRGDTSLGAREMSVADIFGNRVFDFLKPFDGRGTTVTTCMGVTLASLHVQRANDNRRTLLGIEHSRPAHINLAGILQH